MMFLYVLRGFSSKKSLLSIRCLSANRNYYDVLGVPRNASRADIKKAYIEKAKECHPDTDPDSEDLKAEFQEIQKAYEVLSDMRQRAAYSTHSSQTTKPQYEATSFKHDTFINRTSTESQNMAKDKEGKKVFMFFFNYIFIFVGFLIVTRIITTYKRAERQESFHLRRTTNRD